MWIRHLLRKSTLGFVIASILAGAACLLINSQYQAERAKAHSLFIDNVVKQTLEEKSGTLARTFSAIYENARMVSLLPGMRSVKSTNRHGEDDDIIASGKMSRHDYDTVQQVYNNLASDVSVSEIYAVLDGFSSQKGEIPFFMFDSLIVGNEANAGATSEASTADTPEESEDAEYSYYPTQLAELKSRYPRFAFSALDQIPMIASPVMRTCDNSQYPSIRSGDIKNADGILFSVPTYRDSGEFNGLISVIVRSNVLESLLLGVPHLIITLDDAADAQREGWSMPDVSPLILRNKTFGINIFDRRNNEILAAVNNTANEGSTVFTRDILSPNGMEWVLSYQITPAALQGLEDGVWATFKMRFLLCGAVYLIALLGVGVATNMRMSNARLNAMLADVNAAQQALKTNMDATEREAAANKRIRQGLDYCNTGVMITDAALTVIYCNEAMQSLFKARTHQLMRALPSFNADALENCLATDFHPQPTLFRQQLERLTSANSMRITLGELTFDIIAAPILSDDKTRLGITLEWTDMTDVLAQQARDAQKMEEERRIALENFRIRQALDSVSTGALIADAELNIIYVNEAAMLSMRQGEADIRQQLPGFFAQKIQGYSIDQFVGAREQLLQLNQPYSTDITMGNRHYRLVCSPVLSNGNRIGIVVEWTDRTEEIDIEKQIGHMVNASSCGDFSQRIDARNLQGFFKTLADGLNAVAGTTAEALSDICAMLSALAQGDLSQKITKNYSGQFGQLKKDANQTAETLRETVAQINESVSLLQSGIAEVASGMSDLNRRTVEQADALQETSSSMEEMTASVKESAFNTKQANQLVLITREQADFGTQIVKQAITSMQEINTASQRIANITGMINEIAFQTNLLALNAAVEAARAGEQGRGFAVVASEVRSLALRSSSAAKEIRELLQDSQQKVEGGVNLVNQTGDTLNSIAASVSRAEALMSSLATAASQQSAGIQQINEAISRMDKMTNQNAALAEEATTAADSMAAQAGITMEAVAFFRER